MKNKSHLHDVGTIHGFWWFLGLLLAVTTCLVACGPSPVPPQTQTPSPLKGCVGFEDLTVGNNYQVPTTFASSGGTMQVFSFQWRNGGWTNGQGAQASGNGLAGGRQPKEMFLNNVNLGFNVGSPQCVTLRFRDQGGNVNLVINNDMGNWDDLQNASLGGVAVAVNYDPGGQNKGTLTLHGDFKPFNFLEKGWISFAIGGQELSVDDICPCP